MMNVPKKTTFFLPLNSVETLSFFCRVNKSKIMCTGVCGECSTYSGVWECVAELSAGGSGGGGGGGEGGGGRLAVALAACPGPAPGAGRGEQCRAVHT